ncbi:MAG: response regulator [Acetobacteraceae bacterium]|nr:response regulator [Acetobacteraceae bacterium]
MPARVLVVEDDQLQRSVLQAALRSRGHEVETASDGLDAVWKIRSGSYDLVLIDYLLPEMDGLATARLINDIMGSAARPRMLALTARPDSVQARHGDDAFDQVIGKSGNIADLLAEVDRQLQAAPTAEKRKAAEEELLLRDWLEFESVPDAADAAAPRILVVEDDPLQQSVLSSALKRAGYDVAVSADGLDAVRRIRDQDYALVLVDYQTPEIDGLATARLVGELLSEATRPRLLAYTATPERLADWEAEHGKVFDEVVAKSANLPALFAAITRCLHATRGATERA